MPRRTGDALEVGGIDAECRYLLLGGVNLFSPFVFCLRFQRKTNFRGSRNFVNSGLRARSNAQLPAAHLQPEQDRPCPKKGRVPLLL